ncbi:MAG: hypothetical protein E7361_02360 [Clostridiales bacterium]|nr:hypothetical protein [Clostridiales bacterium]
MVAFLIGALAVIVTGVCVIGINNLVVLFYRFLYFIGSWLLRLIEYVQRLFRKLCGLDSAGIDGNLESDPLWALVNNSAVQTAFLSILFLSIVLVFIFAMIQIIRLEYTTEGSKNAKGPIIKSAIKSVFFFAFIPIVSLIGIGVSNVLIGLVEQVTNQGQATSVAGLVFTVAVENNDSNPYRACQNNRGKKSVEWSYNAESIWDVISASISSVGQVFGESLGYDDISGIKGDVNAADGGDSTAGRKKVYYYGDKIYGAQFVGHDDWDELFNNDPGQLDAYFSRLSFTKDEGLSAFTVESKSTDGKAVELEVGDILNYTNSEAVYYFYNVSKIDYIMLFLGGWFVLKALITSAFGVAMRVYKVVILFIISPYPVSLSVLDGGSALNKWKSSFLKELFSAYGVVVGLNLFLILFAEISENKIFEFFTGEPLGGIFNSLTRLVMLLIGCLMIGDIVGIISDYIGGGNVMKEGQGMQKQVTDMAKKAGSAAIGGLTLAAAGATAIGGGIGALKGMRSLNKIAKANKKDEEIINSENPEVTEEEKKEAQERINARKEKTERVTQKLAQNQRHSLRGAMIYKNAMKSTKAFQYVNKGAFGLLESENVAKIDKAIAGKGDEFESVIKSAGAADKAKAARKESRRDDLRKEIKDNGGSARGLNQLLVKAHDKYSMSTENVSRVRTENETRIKQGDEAAAFMKKNKEKYKEASQTSQNATIQIMNANLDLKETRNLSDFNKDLIVKGAEDQEKAKQSLDILKNVDTMAEGKERDEAILKAASLMREAYGLNDKDSDSDVKTKVEGKLSFDEGTYDKMTKAVKDGVSADSVAKMAGADQREYFGKILNDSFAHAIEKLENIKADAKTENGLQELLRAILSKMK